MVHALCQLNKLLHPGAINYRAPLLFFFFLACRGAVVHADLRSHAALQQELEQKACRRAGLSTRSWPELPLARHLSCQCCEGFWAHGPSHPN